MDDVVTQARDDRESLADTAYRALEEQIVTLQIAPGAVVSEPQLAAQLKLGRTPVREALQRLAREGLIEIMPRRGIRVTEINIQHQMRMLELRRVLERLLSEIAAERTTSAERGLFAEIAKDMEHAAGDEDDVAFMRLDRQFNQLLVETGRNEYVNQAMKLVQGLSRRFWYSHYKQALDLPRCARLHSDVARTISDGDAVGAGAASDRLMDYIDEFARSSLDAIATGR